MRDFDLAFIYYWTMDIPVYYPIHHTIAATTTNEQDDEEEDAVVLPMLSSGLQWGACHGVRPLPNISFGGKRWWQFWKI